MGLVVVHTERMSWQWSIELSESEQIFCSDLGVRSRFYCFLRRTRHRIFDDAFTAQLKSMYDDRPGGLPPVPPQILAMSVILQAYTKASDAEAIECIKADRRWQLALGCLSAEGMRFSQKTLAFFRRRLLETGMDEELLARTVELGKESGLFDPKKLGKLRVAIRERGLEIRWGDVHGKPWTRSARPQADCRIASRLSRGAVLGRVGPS